MSIDEAIARERQLAKEQRSHIGTFYSKIMGYDDEYIKKCEVCAEEHEQLAEWLEELKAYRQYIDLTEIPEQYKLGFQDGIVEGNNKAIDDFVKFANTMPTVEEEDGTIRPMWLEEIAEQLKAGVENENF